MCHARTMARTIFSCKTSKLRSPPSLAGYPLLNSWHKSAADRLSIGAEPDGIGGRMEKHVVDPMLSDCRLKASTFCTNILPLLSFFLPIFLASVGCPRYCK